MSEPLFSLTARDFEWSYTKGTGAGGQKKNKTSSAVHVHHAPSGARAYSEASRSQHENRVDAFSKLTKSAEFQAWLKKESRRRMGGELDLERQVDEAVRREMMLNVKIESLVNGEWKPYEDVSETTV